jgi:hypothetical protein
MPDEPDIPPDPPCIPPEPPRRPPGSPGIPPADPADRPGTPAAPPVREVLAAGFTHDDREAGAQGFAAGGPLDQMEPGPALARFASDAWNGGLAGLSDDELVGVLGAARRLTSWASALELTAVAGLGSRRAADARAAGDQRLADHVGDEVAAALTLTCRSADRLVSLAAGVMRLPAVAAALAAGRIDMPKAIIFTDELAGLGDVEAAAVAALVAADAPGLTTGQLRGVLHRAVLALDPDAGPVPAAAPARQDQDQDQDQDQGQQGHPGGRHLRPGRPGPSTSPFRSAPGSG